MQPREASRTAVLVCQGRAAADGRWATSRFQDPIARRLLRADELVPVDQTRADELPSDWRQRMAVESVRACAEVMVPRTVAVDDAIESAGHKQVVIVGAGLDSRPYRLPTLGEVVVYAVDHPASQAEARERSAGLPVLARDLVRVPADLSVGELDRALSMAGHDVSRPTTWVWEGVVPYLTRDEVQATVHTIANRSATGSQLVVAYQDRSFVTVVGRHLSRLLTRLLRLDNPLAAEPWRSLWTPATMGGLLRRYGFTVGSDIDLRTIAERLASPVTHARSLTNGRIVLADRAPTPTDSARPHR
jgi:methyltransferase (TIGR00027 family)